MKRTTIASSKAPAAVGPYSHGVKAGDILYTSGQLGLDPATGKLQDGVKAQATQALTNLQSIIEEAEMTLDEVVKTTVYLSDMGDFAAINSIYAEYFKGEAPARSCVQVAALPLGASFEIEAIVVKAD